ncbi:ABC transporter ATP-binding protein [uncultured Ezakiella sp.]|uniref:ABC transporter ATP-binding protein n=1 Tax=uncultured Ezakiella sp. TaxID=1637529 RepID=UPI0025EDE36F|nr:ABC transporter ATP-binding protein [uncultured Ezakiella sp.]
MFNKHFSEIRKQQILTIILGMINAICAVLSAAMIQKIVDAVINNELDLVWDLSMQFIGLLVAFLLVTFAFQYYLRMMVQTGSFQIRRTIFSNLFNHDYKDISKFKSGDVLTVITSDTERISDMYSQATVKLFIMATQFFVTLGLISYYNYFVTIFALACVVVGVLISNMTSKKIAKYSVDLQRVAGLENSQIIETMDGARTVKQLKKEKYFYKDYKEILDEKLDVSKKLAVQVAIYADVFMFVSNIMPFATVLISLIYVTKGQMTVGQLVAILSIAGALTEPITYIGDLLSKKKVADSLLTKNKNLLEVQGPKADYKHMLVGGPVFKELTFTSDGYSFGERTILEDLNFSFEKGKTYAIVGESGKGKSTIYNIISKFIDSQDVKVQLNGTDINEISAAMLYDRIMQVDQKPFTINKSIYENICLGDKISNEELNEVIDVCQLRNLVEQKGLDFVIDERGENVSGGEKQRISIARMLVRKPDLILLDEPTSALDEKTSENFVRELIDYGNKNDMTIVAITHRDDFTKRADEIIRI